MHSNGSKPPRTSNTPTTKARRTAPVNAATRIARAIMRDIADALVVMAQSDKISRFSLDALVPPLREAAKRRFLYVVREKDIPVAVVIIHRVNSVAASTSSDADRPPLLTKSEWDSGATLAILDIFSIRGDDDPDLKRKSEEILRLFQESLKQQGKSPV